MIRFEKLISEVKYPYIDVVVGSDCNVNSCGNVEDGVFTAGYGKFFIAKVEKGDDAYSNECIVKAGEHVRVVDMSDHIGEIVNIPIDAIEDIDDADIGDYIGMSSDNLMANGGYGASVFIIGEITSGCVRAAISLLED